MPPGLGQHSSLVIGRHISVNGASIPERRHPPSHQSSTRGQRWRSTALLVYAQKAPGGSPYRQCPSCQGWSGREVSSSDPIEGPVHLERLLRSTPSTEIMTKGDNNEEADSSLYPEGQMYLRPHQIHCYVRGYIPIVGRLVLSLQDFCGSLVSAFKVVVTSPERT